MNKANSGLLLLLIIAGLFNITACQSVADRIELQVERPVLPVLTYKDVNPVICLSFVNSDSEPYTINRLEFDLQGTTDRNDVVSLALYGSNKKGFLDTKKVLASAIPAAGKLVFEPTLSIDTDTCRIWVSVQLQDKAGLDHFVQLNCLKAVSSLGEVKVSDANEKKALKVGVAVRQEMQDGVHSSRIPGIATTNKGTLLAIFDARYESRRDLQGHMDIALHRSTDRGQSWEPMQIVLDMGEWGGLPQKFNGVSDACILVDKNSEAIYVAGLWMHGLLDDNGKWVAGLDDTKKEKVDWKHQHQWKSKASQPGTDVKRTSQFLIAKSTDDGLSWSAPDNITAKTKRPEWWLFAPAPGQGITLDDGTLVFPTQGRDEKGKPFSNITYSKDGGTTWVTSNAGSQNTTECNVVQLSDGSLMLNARDNTNRGNTEVNGRNINTTSDLGTNWTVHPTSKKALIEPTCMASLHKHYYTIDGKKTGILLFVNPSNHSVRENMTLKVSLDDGMTWPEKYWLPLDDFRGAGYSSITSIDEHTIGILYESSQAQLVFQQVDLRTILSAQ